MPKGIWRNRALYRSHVSVGPGGLNDAIIEECLPAWRTGLVHASTHGDGTHLAGESVDRIFARHGILWAKDRREYQRYEKAVRSAAQERFGGETSVRARTKRRA